MISPKFILTSILAFTAATCMAAVDWKPTFKDKAVPAVLISASQLSCAGEADCAY